MNYFRSLSESEYAQVKEAIPLITILIAGADGNIDEEETSWATRLTSIRSYANPELLNEFYEDVSVDFSENLQSWISKLPTDTAERTRIISDRLEKLNPVLAKLSPKVGAIAYDSLVSFAKHIANASGGILRFFSVSREEKKLLDLPMLNQIVFSEEEE